MSRDAESPRIDNATAPSAMDSAGFSTSPDISSLTSNSLTSNTTTMATGPSPSTLLDMSPQQTPLSEATTQNTEQEDNTKHGDMVGGLVVEGDGNQPQDLLLSQSDGSDKESGHLTDLPPHIFKEKVQAAADNEDDGRVMVMTRNDSAIGGSSALSKADPTMTISHKRHHSFGEANDDSKRSRVSFSGGGVNGITSTTTLSSNNSLEPYGASARARETPTLGGGNSQDRASMATQTSQPSLAPPVEKAQLPSALTARNVEPLGFPGGRTRDMENNRRINYEPNYGRTAPPVKDMFDPTSRNMPAIFAGQLPNYVPSGTATGWKKLTNDLKKRILDEAAPVSNIDQSVVFLIARDGELRQSAELHNQYCGQGVRMDRDPIKKPFASKIDLDTQALVNHRTYSGKQFFIGSFSTFTVFCADISKGNLDDITVLHVGWEPNGPLQKDVLQTIGNMKNLQRVVFHKFKDMPTTKVTPVNIINHFAPLYLHLARLIVDKSPEEALDPKRVSGAVSVVKAPNVGAAVDRKIVYMEMEMAIQVKELLVRHGLVLLT